MATILYHNGIRYNLSDYTTEESRKDLPEKVREIMDKKEPIKKVEPTVKAKKPKAVKQ